ncbi:hypothetical protein GCM10027578_36440 [Spirosoma luteolum]
MQVPDDGFLLKAGWRFQPGNNPKGAWPSLNDQHWVTLDPTRDIRALPQLQQAGIGWLRLHIHTGPDLPPLMIKLFQSVASEIYLDGRLLYRFGKVSADPDRVQAYNPVAAFSFPLTNSADHVLALRIACQPSPVYNATYINWDAGAVQFWLFPARVLPAIKPVDIESIYLNTFRIGIAFILFILHLSLFLAHASQRANLYAAGMYLLLNIGLLARFANDFTHSLGLRMLVHYGSRIDLWVPGLVVLTFYGLFRFRRGWLFWLAMGSIALKLIPLPAYWLWLSYPINYFLPLELIRLSLVAVRRGLRGGHIVAVCAFCNLGIWMLSSILFSLPIPVYGHEWLYHGLFLVSFLCFPLTLSILLALEHGWVNRQLVDRIEEIETLSAQHLTQQAERQQLLAHQNEQLEAQVTERTEKLIHQADQLRKLDEVKSRFVNNLTHEFRTPLTLIRLPVAKLLQEKRYDGPLLMLVQNNADRLLQLINQLLDLAKLEGNNMPVSLMQGDITAFITQLVCQFQLSADQKGITLVCTIDTLPPHGVRFDADKWEKILTNLLANALKFAPQGGRVSLRVRPVLAGHDLAGVQLELTDSGIGIAPDALPHIFDRFYQADMSGTRMYGGTGIGLSLVKELVDLLGGTLSVSSQPAVGTTFQLTLPVQLAQATDPGPAIQLAAYATDAVIPLLPALTSPPLAQSSSTSEASNPCLLIVEDNDELRAFLVNELSSTYTVMQAADGVEGWEMVQAELPDLVLTDVMMPRMDGHQLTHCIKTHPETDHIAVVMLTAKSNQQSRIEGLRQGADDYLSKPFSVTELHLRLHNLISRQQKLAAYYRQQFALPSVVCTEPEAPAIAVMDPFLTRIYELLDRHLDDDSIGVDWLANQLSMSRKTLYRKVQNLIQLPPADLIRQYRLRKAAELLRSGHNVSETADLTGFSTASHLSALFRKSYGQTPTEFIANRF